MIDSVKEKIAQAFDNVKEVFHHHEPEEKKDKNL
jgi:divalent metal cation (Fe/Co/Zn/Cd) transporter